MIYPSPIHHQGIVDDDVDDVDKDNDDNSSDGGDGDSLCKPSLKEHVNDNNYDDDDDGYDDDRVDDDNDHMQSIREQCPPALLLSGVRLQLREAVQRTTAGQRRCLLSHFLILAFFTVDKNNP